MRLKHSSLLGIILCAASNSRQKKCLSDFFSSFFSEGQGRLTFDLLQSKSEFIQSSSGLLKLIHRIADMSSHHLKVLLKTSELFS